MTSSGSLPHPPRLSGTDSHLWLGWRAGRARDLPRVLRAWPRLGRFVAGFGAQSVAVGEHLHGVADLPGAEEGSFERYLPRAAAADGPSWAAASRAYQAAVIREHIETLRRLKYRPTGGFCVYALTDADPGLGFGLLDAARRAKPAYTAAMDACRPVIVVADPPPDVLTAGDHLDLALHVVSDLPHPLTGVRLTARITIAAHTTVRGWTGDIEADSCTYVGRLRAEVPATHGPVVIDLSVEGTGVVATNRYRTTVIPPAEAVARHRTTSRR